ncbi:helix-turn-helix transcriptional regulator [Adlercreutzia sp. R7]|uniref:Helix-turn-helix transcriptional regulator n=1 Tax=Adlercreutzia wanghongyangiae TaxID=3111451 RepID=A0ABU6IJY4_9ACTN|nr:helix-turn-helix transcriptional regulator [Adlercreutzia sp. R7]
MTHSSAPSAAPGALSRLEGALKLRYLGIGFIWAWIYGSYETFAVYPERVGIGINADESWVISATVVVITMFATGLLLGRRPAAPRRRLALAASIAAAAGTVLSALPASGDTPALALFASGLLTGFGTGALYVLWGQALARLDAESAEVAIPSASLVMFAGALVLPYLPGFAGVAATATLPLLSGLLLWLTYRDPVVAWEGDEPEDGDAPHASVENARTRSSEVGRTLLPAPIARISALVLLSYFTVGCCGALQQGADKPFIVLGLDAPTIIGSLGGIVLMACFVLFASRPRFDSLFRLIAPLIVGSAALLPWADLWAVFLSETLVSLADTILTIATVLFVTDAARRGLVNAAAGVGITQGSLQLGVLLGNLAGSAASPLASASTTGLFSIALGLTAFFALTWLLYPAERDRRASGSCRGISSDLAGEHSDGAVHVIAGNLATGTGAEGSRETTLEAACNVLAEAHGLSGREREILGYLARGRSQPYIREELVLSKNTVATHVKHIYQKLGVHSRQELLDLFE